MTVGIDRAQRFRMRLEQTVPHQLTLPPLGAAGLAGVLGCLTDGFEALGPTLLRVRRKELPAAVLLNTADMLWRSEDDQAEGCGLVELATWLRDRDILSTHCMIRTLLLIHRTH